MTLPTYQDIISAKEVLELPEQASMNEIKARYRTLITRWHPDTCTEDPEQCKEMAAKLTAAYKTVLLYCNSYRYSFAARDVEQYLSEEEWWHDRFGADPLWGRGEQ